MEDLAGRQLFYWNAGGEGETKSQNYHNNDVIVGIYGYTGAYSWITNFGFVTVRYD